MKKMKTPHFAATSLCLVLAISFSATAARAELMLPTQPSGYNFGPEGRSIEDAREYGKPNEMVGILPGKMVKAHDASGNILYYQLNGRRTIKLSPNGNMEVTYKKKTTSYNSEGKVIGSSERIEGTNKVELRNDKGQLIGWQFFKYGGKTVEEYDYEGNKTKTTQYNKYGKAADYVLDEMTQTRTVFQPNGKPKADIEYEGNEVAWYHYSENGQLATKTDIHGDTTHFDGRGNMTYTENHERAVVATYRYTKDDEGHYFLDSSVDLYGSITKYNRDGKPQIETTADGHLLKEYNYDGQALRYTFDNISNEVTWFNPLNGKPVYSTNDGVCSHEWLYYKGRTVGVWATVDNSITVYIREQEMVKIFLPEKPTAEEVQEWIDKGYIKKQYGDKE